MEEQQAEEESLMSSAAEAPDETIDAGMAHQAADEAAEDDELDRPDWFPEKFWDEKEGPDLENFTKSYKELEKQFRNGEHKAPESYDMSTLAEAGYGDDDPIVDAYSSWAKKYGISQAAFSELAGQITEMSGMEMVEAERTVADERKKMGPNADAIIRSNVDWADGLLRKDIISKDEREMMNQMGNSAVAQGLYQKFRAMSGDLSPIPTVASSDGHPTDQEFKEAHIEKMKDPRYTSDPAFRASIQKAYANHPWKDQN